MVISIEELPPQLLCDDEDDEDCEGPHFLAVNRCSDGSWSAAYLSYSENDVSPRTLGPLYLNHAENLREVAVRMDRKLLVWNRQHG